MAQEGCSPQTHQYFMKTDSFSILINKVQIMIRIYNIKNFRFHMSKTCTICKIEQDGICYLIIIMNEYII